MSLKINKMNLALWEKQKTVIVIKLELSKENKNFGKFVSIMNFGISWYFKHIPDEIGEDVNDCAFLIM